MHKVMTDMRMFLYHRQEVTWCFHKTGITVFITEIQQPYKPNNDICLRHILINIGHLLHFWDKLSWPRSRPHIGTNQNKPATVLSCLLHRFYINSPWNVQNVRIDISTRPASYKKKKSLLLSMEQRLKRFKSSWKISRVLHFKALTWSKVTVSSGI